MPSTRRSTGKTCASAPMFFGQRERLGARLQIRQVAAERVDHAVDGLVGHRLAGIRAPAQDEDVAAAIELVEEVVHHHRLAEARQAVDAHRDGAAFARRLEGVVKSREGHRRVR